MLITKRKNQILFIDNGKEVTLFEGTSKQTLVIMKKMAACTAGRPVPEKVVWILQATNQADRAEKARSHFGI